MEEPSEIHIAIEVPAVREELPNISSQATPSEPVLTNADETEEAPSLESGSVLQLNLTGDSLEKFAKILHEKGIQTAEDAIHYFYLLHNSKGDAVTGVGNKKSRGRPRGSRNKELIARENQRDDEEEKEEEQVKDGEEIAKDSETSDIPGTVLVGGVRKSTRSKKDPFRKSEYVSSNKLEDDELEDGIGWDLEVDANDVSEEEVGEGAAAVEEPLVDIINSEPSTSQAGPSQSESSLSDLPPTHSIRIIQGKKSIRLSQSTVSAIRKKLSIKRSKVGRPRRRAREAVLWADEESTQNCRKCGEHFDSLAALRTHKMAAHSRPNYPYFCEHCDYTAMYDCDMKRHQLVHSESKQFSCEICDFSTNWERNINLHMENVHAKNKPWKCDRCDLKIYNHSKVKQHQLSHNPNAFKCNQCEYRFETLAKLQWHKKNMHPKDNEKLQCTECDYTATTSVNMKLHMKNKHNVDNRQREKQLRRKRQLTCEICNRRLINEEQKEVHMQIHEPENRDSLKPYYCTVCSARCADINQMVRHRAIHTENKPYACKSCDYVTRWKKDLKTHEMIHTGEKNVHCPHCNYSCYTKQRLRAHLIKHDESRQHLCPLCNMSFKSKQALRMHTMYHTGDASYSCTICDFRTVTELRLRKHMLRHTNERNFSCNLCGKRFKQPHHVTQHRDIVHLGKPSYRERKRIALQQSAAEALGSLNTTEINFGGQTYTVLNEDGSTTLMDLSAVVAPPVGEPPREETQYVMVETPAGYQYVAVVMPENGQGTSEPPPTSGLVEDTPAVAPADATNLDDTQILLTQAGGVYYTTSGIAVGGEANQSVDTLVSLQPQQLPTDLNPS